jgi:tungstate transport system substrate-binding protein
VSLSRPASSLRNVYSVLRIDPERFEREIQARGAKRFADFLLEPETGRRIAEFGRERFGRPLFRPRLEVAEASAP